MTAQDWSASAYATNARFVAVLGRPVVDLLAPKPGEWVLDLGCGDGALTAELVAAGCRVVGVDSAPDLVAAARARGLDIRLQDAARLDLPERFDAVFSNAALHWMKDPASVLAGVHRQLRPGGRFVGEMGGHGNVASITTSLLAALERHSIDGRRLSPWHFPSVGRWRRLLEEAGFRVDQIALIPRPTALPTGIAGWLATFAGPFVQHLPAEVAADVLAHAESLLAFSLRDEEGNWTADYVRLRFTASLPGPT